MTRLPDSADPPLAADDPRISEWLDGRLPPAAAAEVERAVRASPELVRLVEDLRAVRATLRGLPVAEPPAGFSGRVMTAVAEGSRAADGGRPPPRGLPPRPTARIWRSWPALAAALAAGVLVAIVLNLPGPGDREVAVGPAPREVADDAWTPRENERLANAGPVASADAEAAGTVAAAAAATAERAGQTRKAGQAGQDAGGQPLGAADLRSLAADEQPARAVTAAAPPPGTARDRSGSETAAAFGAEEKGRGARPQQAMAGMLAIEVRSAASRQALDRLVAASGLEVTRSGERLELVGAAAAMHAFLGELERAGLLAASRRREIRDTAGGDRPERLIIRLVEPNRGPRPGAGP